MDAKSYGIRNGSSKLKCVNIEPVKQKKNHIFVALKTCKISKNIIKIIYAQNKKEMLKCWGYENK